MSYRVKRMTACRAPLPNNAYSGGDNKLKLPNLERPMGPDKLEHEIRVNELPQSSSSHNEIKHVRFSSESADCNNNSGGSQPRKSNKIKTIASQSNGVKLLAKCLQESIRTETEPKMNRSPITSDEFPGGSSSTIEADKMELETLKETKPNKIVLENEGPPQVPWSELTTKGKVKRVLIGVGKTLALLLLLYMFVCSLDLLSLGFRLVGGRTAGEIFKRSELLQNPVVGVMIGVLTTVLVQSSSTSTSIIVGMVAAGFLEVQVAIPIIMGANIGTSITNTIVSFSQAGEREMFKRAFAGATILDMFNWLAVIVLLIVEQTTGYLYHVSTAVMNTLVSNSSSAGQIQLLSALTNPFVNLIVQLDSQVLECWSNPNCTSADDATLVRQFCSDSFTTIEVTEEILDNHGNVVMQNVISNQVPLKHECDFIFHNTGMSDAAVGAIVLIISLITLCSCLVLIVKVLSSVLKGQLAVVIQKTLNADIPYVPWITGYIAIVVGAVMTFLVQSSSVFTSSLTPLVGLGVISIERVYPLMLGSNIGTTTTAILASMAVTGDTFYPSMQIAFCHFFFNLTGILLFYPIPYLRFPIQLAKFLGKTTAKYRWFAILYMITMFGLLPALFVGLSILGSIYMIIFLSLLGVILAIVTIMKCLQRLRPQWLPVKLRNWKWLPAPLRSLEPYDKLISRCNCRCCKCCGNSENSNEGYDEPDYEPIQVKTELVPQPVHYVGNNRLQNSNFDDEFSGSDDVFLPSGVSRNSSIQNGHSGVNTFNELNRNLYDSTRRHSRRNDELSSNHSNSVTGRGNSNNNRAKKWMSNFVRHGL